MRSLGPIRTMGSWLAIRANIRNERGASAVEYGIMIAMIAAVVILAVLFLGRSTSDTFRCTAQMIQDQSSGC